MKKNVLSGILAVIAVAFAVLFLLASNDRGKLSEDNTSLAGQVTSLSQEKEALAGQVTSLGQEKEALAGQVTSLNQEKEALAGQKNELEEKLAQAAETAKAKKEEAVKAGEEKAALLQAQLEEAVKAREEADAALQAALEEAARSDKPDAAENAVKAGSVDFAAAFPSWNPDSAALKELISFVEAAVDESGAGYIPAADRLAVFDMDGTIICEKAPVYLDYCLTMYRVLDDPTGSFTEEEREAMQQVRDHAYSKGETFKPKGINKHTMIATGFAGMTPEEFRAYVVDFIDKTDAVGFSGMTYGQSFYRPMLEVINFLRANSFDVWMVSACEREVVRAIVERIGIPLDHVVATDVPYVASGNEGAPADEYNMSRDEVLLLGAPLADVEVGKSGKPAAIVREIGKRPVLAFGNSSGDYSMLNYAEGNPAYAGMGVLIVCDDTVREYGSDEKAAGFYAEAEKEEWTAVSMANDWATIYGDGVEKTGLPGAQEEAEEETEALPDAA